MLIPKWWQCPLHDGLRGSGSQGNLLPREAASWGGAGCCRVSSPPAGLVLIAQTNEPRPDKCVIGGISRHLVPGEQAEVDCCHLLPAFDLECQDPGKPDLWNIRSGRAIHTLPSSSVGRDLGVLEGILAQIMLRSPAWASIKLLKVLPLDSQREVEGAVKNPAPLAVPHTNDIRICGGLGSPSTSIFTRQAHCF